MNHRPTEILIIGAGFAGLMTAARLHVRGLTRTPDVRIRLIAPHDVFVHRPRLHELLGRGSQRATRSTLPLQKLQKMLPRGVEHVRERVVRIDPDAQTVTCASGATHRYDHLVYAPGGQTATHDVPGVEHTTRVEQWRDFDTIRTTALAAETEQVVVVGGGLTGVELACELAALRGTGRAPVTLLTSALCAGLLHPDAQSVLRAQLTAANVVVREGACVSRVDPASDTNRRPLTLTLTDHTTRSADLCVWAAGQTPSTLARDSGLPTTRSGRLDCLPTLQSPHYKNIWGAGDAATPDHHPGGPMAMTCAVAMPQGAHIGDQLARVLRGEEARPFSFGYMLRCIGLGPHRALIQHTDGAGVATPRFYTGRAAVWTKEAILRMVIHMIRMERTGRFAWYQWPASPRTPAPSPHETRGDLLRNEPMNRKTAGEVG